MTSDRPAVVLDYRLTEADVRRYARSARARTCGRIGRDHAWGLLALLAIGLLLIGLAARSHGARPPMVAALATLGVLAGLAWLREATTCRAACRMARDSGVPLDVKLTVGSEGLSEEPPPGNPEPARTFAWSEVVEVERLRSITVIRLRPGGGVLLIPDRAFSESGAADRFAREAQAWHRESKAAPA